MSTPEEAHKIIYDEGAKLRRKVLGDAHVDKTASHSVSDFLKSAQDLVIESAWGTCWTRDGLTHKQRSLLNIGILATSGLLSELGLHIKGALNNGLTEVEIREALLQVMVYTGIPNGYQAFKVADAAIQEYKGAQSASK